MPGSEIFPPSDRDRQCLRGWLARHGRQGFPDAFLIRNTDNRGFAAANNQGFEIAQGRHILLLNSDTIVHGTVLAESVAWLEAHPDVGAMGCRVLNTDGTMQPTCHMFPSVLNQFLMATGLWKLKRPRFFGRMHMTDWQRDSERAVETISGCYLLVRRKVMDQVGLLDEDFFFFGEETDWCKRMRDAGWRLMFAPVGEITHHGGGSVKKLNHKRDVMLTARRSGCTANTTARLRRRWFGSSPLGSMGRVASSGPWFGWYAQAARA